MVAGAGFGTTESKVVCFSNTEIRKIRWEHIPDRCGRGHPLTPENLRIDGGEQRWRCLRCGAERAAAFRSRHRRAV